ncbi:MAG TPA: TonB-dependent receptor [Sediminibacterium sp.]|nr:TonB-dependent receptor [Sediminibacterium sp.]
MYHFFTYRLIYCRLCLLLCWGGARLNAQSTTGHITGTVTLSGQPVAAAILRLKDPDKGILLQGRSNAAGMFQFNHLQPGNSWKLECITPVSDTLEIDAVEVQLGRTIQIDLILPPLINRLKPVLVRSTAKKPTGLFTITAEQSWKLPYTGSNLFDWLMTLPQAYSRDRSSGAVSFSGQNNRYNSLYVDGALQNDVFGLSPSGTYGGQANSSPVSPETIEQLQLQLSPYDASLGNYTGAAINLITKSGKKKRSASIYRSVTARPNPAQTTGFTLSGPLRANRSFYYFNTDYHVAENTTPYSFGNYAGATRNEDQLNRFVQSMITRYGYDPGKPDAAELQRALKLTLRIDRLIGQKQLLTYSMRQQFSERVFTGSSTPLLLFFSNNGKQYRSGSFSGTISLNGRYGRHSGNELVIGYTWSNDHTMHLGKPFPSLRILDGKGMLFLGSNEDAQNNSTTQSSWTIRDKFFFNKGKHQLNWGIETTLNRFHNRFLQNRYGAYFYYSIADFLQQYSPAAYRISYYREQPPYNQEASQNIASGLWTNAVFVNDRLTFGRNCILQAGIRITAQKINGTTNADSITYYRIIPALLSYYDLAGTRYGEQPSLRLSLAPRFNLTVRSKQGHWQLEIGTGIFSGRMPMAWLNGIYSNNGLMYESFEAGQQQRKNIRFSGEADRQWRPDQTGGVANKGVLNLVAGKISMPSVWRSTVQWTGYWSDQSFLQLECMYYLNRKEIHFSNVNLLPATKHLSGPDNRMIYSPGNNRNIPVFADSSNPYEQIILLQNNPGQQGYGYRLGITLEKKFPNTGFTMGYSYNDAYSVFDGNYSVLLNQWRLNETVNGRNHVRLSRSDFSAGHRVHARVTQEWQLLKPALQIKLGLNYLGCSGNTYSYVYGKNNLTGDDPSSTGYDLIYIPTKADLDAQVFLPLITEQYFYTPEQQKEALDWYIQQSPYLKKHRGAYASRNGSRTPFQHRIDCKFVTSVQVKLHRKKYGFSFSATLQNLANLLNPDWGNVYIVPGNSIRLIQFLGFIRESPLTPAFGFDPELMEERGPQKARNKTFRNIPEWQLLLGFRINFY